MEATSASLNSDITSLTARSASLCENISNLKDLLQEKEAQLKQTEQSHKETIEEQERDSTSRLDAADKKIKQLEEDLFVCRRQGAKYQDKFETTEARLRRVEAQLEEAQEMPTIYQEEVFKLKEQLAEREGETNRLHVRSQTIAARYKSGDLVCFFFNSIMTINQCVVVLTLRAKWRRHLQTR